LERLLSVIAAALRGNEQATLAMHTLLLAQGKQLVELHQRLGSVRVEGASVSDELRTQTAALKALAAAIVDSRQSVDDSRTKLLGATKELAALRQDITGEHVLMSHEEHGDAPRSLHVLIKKITNIGWRHGIRWAGAALGAGGGLKLLWDTIAPLLGVQ
jgi:septal ring factor EnvC (AmiA/AmiB activator)